MHSSSPIGTDMPAVVQQSNRFDSRVPTARQSTFRILPRPETRFGDLRFVHNGKVTLHHLSRTRRMYLHADETQDCAPWLEGSRNRAGSSPSRTCDEDINQSSGALLPITAGAHVGDSYHRPKEIGGVNVFSHVAALFRALDQIIDCSLDQAARTLIEPGRTSGNTVEGGRNNVLGRDVIDEQQQPGAQRLNRGHRDGEPMRCSGKLFNLTPVDRFDQRIPCREMAIQSTGPDTRLFRYVVQTGIGAVARKGSFRHFENSLAVTLGIRSWPSLGRFGTFLCHFQKIL